MKDGNGLHLTSILILILTPNLNLLLEIGQGVGIKFYSFVAIINSTISVLSGVIFILPMLCVALLLETSKLYSPCGILEIKNSPFSFVAHPNFVPSKYILEATTGNPPSCEINFPLSFAKPF